VLEGNRGVVGVGGSAEVDGDDIGCWELSSARTTFAGVPLGIQNVKDVLRPWITAMSRCYVQANYRLKLSDSACERPSSNDNFDCIPVATWPELEDQK
jgi:hypothetical protein